MERKFSPGSRQAPDPYDQYLEQHNFYRKHTARDASCLFRVISEQMYDTQLHHLAIRDKCVTYMRKYRQYFENEVDRDLDEYLDDMSKPKTYGTLLELQAVGYMFQRNVLLFEPYNLGSYLNEYCSYYSQVFRVFYSPEVHFDSVFTSSYIKNAAMCQSICYEILYRDVFKLPDITFAVEQMLYAHTYENVEYSTDITEDGYSTGISWSDGRRFEFDLPQDTNCILENHRLCHFHFSNFPRFSDDLQRQIKNTARDENDKNTQLMRTTDSVLPNKHVSCVRQLLQEGITPFPYKVAKALDPSMYRNIEFDSWNEMRKEYKMQNWYSGDANFKLIHYSTKRVHKIFQVGAKCHVKLFKSEQDLYTCYVQEISVDKGYCVVFVEQLGERRLVPYDALTPLPPNQFQPWSLPYRFQRHMHRCSSLRFTRHYNYRFKFNNDIQRKGFCDQAIKTADTCFKQITKGSMEHYTHLENFRAQTVQYCTMPLTIEKDMGNGDANNRCGTGAGDADVVSQAASNSPSIHNNPDLNNNCENSADNAVAYSAAGTASGYELEHQSGGHDGPLYIPDHPHGYYSLSPYAPEDHYGYGYEGGLQASTHSSAFLPVVNRAPAPYYYVCNGPGNPYMPPPPLHSGPMNGGPIHGGPMHGGPMHCGPMHGMHGSPMPMLASSAVVNSGVFPTNSNIPPAVANASFPNVIHHNPAVTVPSCESPIVLGNEGQGTSTSYHSIRGRTRNRNIASINFEAKRSVKLNGSDLPSDVTTLRYFYNLGLDYYHIHFKRNYGVSNTEAGSSSINENKEEVIKSSADTAMNSKASERSDKFESNTVESEYTSCNTLRAGINFNYNNQSSIRNQRRYNTRNYKDRQAQQPTTFTGNFVKHNNYNSVRTNKGMGKYAAAYTTNVYKSNESQYATFNQQHNDGISGHTRQQVMNTTTTAVTVYNYEGGITRGNINMSNNTLMTPSTGNGCGGGGGAGSIVTDFNCDGVFPAPLHNGSYPPYTPPPGVYVPVPTIAAQYSPYHMPPPPPTSIRRGFHSAAVNGHDCVPSAIIPVNASSCPGTGANDVAETPTGPEVSSNAAVNLMTSMNYPTVPCYYSPNGAPVNISLPQSIQPVSQNYWCMPSTSPKPMPPMPQHQNNSVQQQSCNVNVMPGNVGTPTTPTCPTNVNQAQGSNGTISKPGIDN